MKMVSNFSIFVLRKSEPIPVSWNFIKIRAASINFLLGRRKDDPESRIEQLRHRQELVFLTTASSAANELGISNLFLHLILMRVQVCHGKP